MTQSQPSIHEAAIEILRETKDGNDLSPRDLKLVELTLNDAVGPASRAEFFRLLDRVRAGYTPEPFHGIEHMTYNQQGFVCWKGQVVEHFSIFYAYTDEAGDYTQRLADRCRELEARGQQPDMGNVVWHWCDDPAKG